jgi:hypothetical protein
MGACSQNDSLFSEIQRRLLLPDPTFQGADLRPAPTSVKLRRFNYNTHGSETGVVTRASMHSFLLAGMLILSLLLVGAWTLSLLQVCGARIWPTV